MAWFDTHCHLDFPPFNDDLSGHLANFAKANVAHCMVPAVAPNNWQTVLRLASLPSISVALGYHPCFLNPQALGQNVEALEPELERLQNRVEHAFGQVSAWGECGLDGRFPETMSHQLFAFRWQIAAAQELSLPLLIHSVRLHDQVAQLLKQQQYTHGGIIHGFSGSYVQARRFVDLGFKIGIGGTITWPRSEKTRKAIKRLSLNALVLETDAPDMPLYQMTQPHNTPVNLAVIFHQLLALRNESSEQLEQALWQNSVQALNLSI